MGFKAIKPVPKAKSCAIKDQEYVRLTNKMLYINAGAAKYLCGDYIQILIDQKRELIKLVPCSKDDENAFKLSKVNETRGARRIETNNALQSFRNAELPAGEARQASSGQPVHRRRTVGRLRISPDSGISQRRCCLEGE